MILIRKEENDLVVTALDFDLAQTLNCGQSFRWQQTGEKAFCGIAFGRLLHVEQTGNDIIFHDTSLEEFHRDWRAYFDFDTNYEAIREYLRFDETIAHSYAIAGGIHILRQEPWEALCSFIFSQNNNIPRIKGIIERFCATFGERAEEGFSFPSPQRIAALTADDLAPIRAGFRAKYVIDAAQKVTNGIVDLRAASILPLEEAREELMQIKGVGVKVADCTLLFGMHRLEAFPVDVWVKRVLERYYPAGFPDRAKPYGGVAQQYLFHWIRMESLQ